MTNLSGNEHVLSQEHDEQLRRLRDENRLLFDQLELVQHELACLLGEGAGASGTMLSDAGVTPVVSDDVIDYLFEAMAENIRNQTLVATQKHLFFLQSQRALDSQLGRVLIDASGSIKALLSTPSLLWRAWRQSRSSSAPKALGGKSFHKAVQAYKLGGQAAVESLLSKSPFALSTLANAWTAVARSQLQVDTKIVAQLARRAYELEPLPFRQKWLAFRLYEAGELLEAEALTALLPEDMVFSESEGQQLLSLQNGAKQYRFDQARQAYESQ